MAVQGNIQNLKYKRRVLSDGATAVIETQCSQLSAAFVLLVLLDTPTEMTNAGILTTMVMQPLSSFVV